MGIVFEQTLNLLSICVIMITLIMYFMLSINQNMRLSLRMPVDKFELYCKYLTAIFTGAISVYITSSINISTLEKI